MKTQISKKTISSMLLVLIASGSAFAQTKNSLKPIEDESSNHLTLALSVLLFIIGFVILFVLKRRDDKKYEMEDKRNVSYTHGHHLHRNHYGHNHQYHH